MKRDNQRSKVYAFEKAATAGSHYKQAFKTIEECEAFLKPIWRAERGRLGRANIAMPELRPASWGQRRALAHHSHKISLPLWARNPWVVLHEAAHRLTPNDEAHGPRFVGALIGLVCRHMDFDAGDLMALADKMGVKYHVRSIGAVPVHGPAWWIEKTVREHGPMTEMDIACWLGLSYLQARGGALALIRKRRARWLRKKLVLIGDAIPPPEAPPAAPKVVKPRAAPGVNTRAGLIALADTHGIEIEQADKLSSIWVYAPDGLDPEDDPFEVEGHFCDDWTEARARVKTYIDLLDKQKAGSK